MREDWIEIEFGKLCTFSQGIQVPVSEQYENPADGLIRFLRIVDFTQGDEPPRYVKRVEGVHNVNREDISMVRYGTVGFVCTNKEGAIANNLFRIIPNYDIDKKYLIHFLKSVFFKRHLNSKGATMAALSFGLIKPISIPIPPLPEQRAIVAKIEQLFSELDNGIANLKAAKEKLEIYRQAVLKKAFEGGFTKTVQWKPKKLGEIIKIRSGNGLTKANRNDEGKYLVYGGNGITGRHDEFMFEDKQLIIGRVGVHCGNTHITEPNSWVTDNAFVVTFDKENITLKCLYYLISSLRLNQYSSSTAQPVISGGKIYPIKFLFPPKEIQKNIVEEIETRLSVCDSVLANINEALEKSEALRQSILKKAFEGKLLSEAELQACRKEPDWEPAEKLLARIEQSRNEKIKNKKAAKV